MPEGKKRKARVPPPVGNHIRNIDVDVDGEIIKMSASKRVSVNLMQLLITQHKQHWKQDIVKRLVETQVATT